MMGMFQAAQAIRQLMEDRDKYKEEVQALNKGVRSWEKSAMQQLVENRDLQKENQRLREALRFISNEDTCNAHDMIQIAQQALKQTTRETDNRNSDANVE